MLLTTHVLTGAALGSLVGDVPGRGLFAFVIGWASHYVLDALPHKENFLLPHGFKAENVPITQWPMGMFVQTAIDVLLALGLLGLIVGLKNDFNLIHSPQFWGALGAAFPDVLDQVPFWNKIIRQKPIFKTLWNWHSDFHVSEETQSKYTNNWGVIVPIILMGGAAWVLFLR